LDLRSGTAAVAHEVKGERGTRDAERANASQESAGLESAGLESAGLEGAGLQSAGLQSAGRGRRRGFSRRSL